MSDGLQIVGFMCGLVVFLSGVYLWTRSTIDGRYKRRFIIWTSILVCLGVGFAILAVPDIQENHKAAQRRAALDAEKKRRADITHRDGTTWMAAEQLFQKLSEVDTTAKAASSVGGGPFVGSNASVMILRKPYPPIDELRDALGRPPDEVQTGTENLVPPCSYAEFQRRKPVCLSRIPVPERRLTWHSSTGSDDSFTLYSSFISEHSGPFRLYEIGRTGTWPVGIRERVGRDAGDWEYVH